MNILVINGSPRGENGNTKVLTDAFLEGATESGAETEIVYLKDKHIEHCCGEFYCWKNTPGVCKFNDDMPELLEKWSSADIIVIASPLYVFTVTTMMKGFMDRLLPLVQPYVEIKDGLSSHPRRFDHGSRSFVLISNCGFPEQEHFSGLKETFRRWIRGADRTIAGMICCAGGEVLRQPALRNMLAWYLDAVTQAGREVATQGCVSPETQSILDKPLIEDQELFAQKVNEYWDSVLA
jgi:hypothetical protein